MGSLSDVRVKRKISSQLYINVWLSMMSGMTQMYFSLIKKIKIGRPEHLLTRPPPLKVDVICVSPLIIKSMKSKIPADLQTFVKK